MKPLFLALTLTFSLNAFAIQHEFKTTYNLRSLVNVNQSIEIKNDTQFNAALKAKGYTLIKFGGADCGPCADYDKDVAQIATKLSTVNFYHINADEYGDHTVENSLPEFQLYLNGKLTKSFTGYRGSAGLIDQLNTLMGVQKVDEKAQDEQKIADAMSTETTGKYQNYKLQPEAEKKKAKLAGIPCSAEKEKTVTVGNRSSNGISCETEFDAAIHSGKYVVIKYGANYCPPCRQYDHDIPEVLKNEDMKDINFYIINVQATYRGHSRNGGIPQFHFYKDGKLVDVITGYGDPEGLAQRLKELK